MKEQLSTIEQAIDALRAGKPVLVADAADRENEGDAIMAAEFANAHWINWIIRNSSGYLCAPMTEERANQLDLPLMTGKNQDRYRTQYTVSVDAARDISTGISAADRAKTIQMLADKRTSPADLIRPGHVLPLRANVGGVLARAGHTEATVDLLSIAGLTPVGVIAEITNEDGTMTRLPELLELGKKEGLPVVTIEQLKDYILEHNFKTTCEVENRVSFSAEANVPTEHGMMRMRGYYDHKTTADHVAIVSGHPGAEDVLVRVHSECITGEAFGSKKCECGPQLQFAMNAIDADPNGGIVLYLRGQEGRGIGLLNKLKAYSLQEQGLDTVEANLALGLPSENREYGAAVAMLRDLGVKSVRLMTNNPAKRDFLVEAGIRVNSYVPILVGVAAENEKYLTVKRDKMGHMLPEDVK
ncbi:MAG: 3,4-dihydroxy-2-butanone-4-phosphate synthase [Micrococcales bacterium]